MTDREIELLELIKKNPMATQDELAEKLFISRSTVSVYITNLMNKGYIKGRGYVLSEDYIVCMGTANVDIIGYASVPLIKKDKNPGASIQTSAGGVARNIGENLAHMGVNVKMFTTVGDDYYSRIIIDSCKAAGMDTEEIQTIKGASTAAYMSIYNSNGHMELGLTDMCITESLDLDYLKERRAILSNARAIVLSPDLPESSMEYLQQNFYEIPKFIGITAIEYSKKVLQYLSMFHTVALNPYEMEVLTGIPIKEESDLERSADQLLKSGVQNVYITLKEKGAFFKNNSGKLLRIKEVSFTQSGSAIGAEDAFVAGVVYSYLNHFDYQKSLQFSNSASQIALSHNAVINPDISATAVLNNMKKR